MSGGAFDYQQYRINDIAETIKEIIAANDQRDWYKFSAETIAEFAKAIEHLHIARIYAQRIDWLVSGDDGEESFHQRLAQDLEEFRTITKKD